MRFLAAVPEDVSASYILAGVLGLVFLGILYFGSWRGYRGGAIRCVATLISFAVAVFLAWLCGVPLGFAVLGNFGVPWILRGLLGMLFVGCLACLITFAVLWAFGRGANEESTGEPVAPIRGAVVGCWTGILAVATLLFLIAGAGTLGETLLSRHDNDADSFMAKLCRGAIVAKKSVALLPGLAFAETWNPLPSGAVRKLEKLVVVMSRPDTATRFIYTPELQSVMTLPSVYPVFYSADIQEMVRNRDIEGLLADPQINQLLDDEDVQRAVTEIDFEKVLDQILAGKLNKD
ncbi:MAG: CvpA family protein [Opitutae bacterium]|nr:CvpA family protein [Opitutae bacterium]